MVRMTRAESAVHDAGQAVEWLVGIALSFDGSMPDARLIKHDVQVAVKTRTLKYCALQAVSHGTVAASWWSVPMGGTVAGFEPAVPLSSYARSRCAPRFVLYETDEYAHRRDCLVLSWDRADDVGLEERYVGQVTDLPRRGRNGRISLKDDRSALLLPQDASGLTLGSAVECVVARSISTGALAGLLVSEVNR